MHSFLKERKLRCWPAASIKELLDEKKKPREGGGDGLWISFFGFLFFDRLPSKASHCGFLFLIDADNLCS